MNPQIFFLVLAFPSLVLGIPRLFFPERVFYFVERMRYAYPLEPSPFCLRSMRIGGLILSLAGAGLAWLGIMY